MDEKQSTQLIQNDLIDDKSINLSPIFKKHNECTELINNIISKIDKIDSDNFDIALEIKQLHTISPPNKNLYILLTLNKEDLKVYLTLLHNLCFMSIMLNGVFTDEIIITPMYFTLNYSIIDDNNSTQDEYRIAKNMITFNTNTYNIIITIFSDKNEVFHSMEYNMMDFLKFIDNNVQSLINDEMNKENNIQE